MTDKNNFPYTRGPWFWSGRSSKPVKDMHLATRRGKLQVMDFVRWGAAQAKPRFVNEGLLKGADDLIKVDYYGMFTGINHPDAILLAAAPEMFGLLQKIAEVYPNVLAGFEAKKLIDDIESRYSP